MNCNWEENLSMSQHLFILSEQTEYPSLREWLGERRAGSGTGTEVWDCPVPVWGRSGFVWHKFLKDRIQTPWSL